MKKIIKEKNEGKEKDKKKRLKKSTRSQMIKYYKEYYSDIPEDIGDRLLYLSDKLKLSDKDVDKIIDEMERIQSIKEKTICIILWELPMATDRAKSSNGRFYVGNAKSHSLFMKKKLKELGVDDFILTNTKLYIDMYLPTPNDMNKIDKVLSELKVLTPQTTPDWDNGGKTYSDMANINLLFDDKIVDKAQVRKFYSCKPRVELVIKYKEEFPCLYQKNKVLKSKQYESVKLQRGTGDG